MNKKNIGGQTGEWRGAREKHLENTSYLKLNNN